MTEFTAQLSQKEEIADNTFAFTYVKPEGFEFIAGQYVVLDVDEPRYSDDRPSFRSLSIASAPSDQDLLFVMRGSDSAFKRSMIASEVGDTVTLKGPIGHFILPEDKNRKIVYLGAGIGITPIRSMIREELHSKSERSQMLFYSNRLPESAAYALELRDLDLPDYKCVNTMTDLKDDVPENIWAGERGFITAEMIEEYCDFYTDVQYYIVGTKPFINAMKETLNAMGIDEKSITVDNFG